MPPLPLHAFHAALGAEFTELSGAQAVARYGDPAAEHPALTAAVGWLDFSFRSRLVLTGADRVRLLNGQVTNDVKALASGHGCYAALLSVKGRMQSDLHIFNLGEELLLDFEPGLSSKVAERIEQYIIADDVQVHDVAPLFGLLTVQGPQADAVLSRLGAGALPRESHRVFSLTPPDWGQCYFIRHPWLGSDGFDLHVPLAALETVATQVHAAVRAHGGCACGWNAFDIARVEAGLPRFGVDMDEATLPPEAGIESRAISYTKGCYIGQEIIARLRSVGHINRRLAAFRLTLSGALPARGEKLIRNGVEAGFITSAVVSPRLGPLALGCVRCDQARPGVEFELPQGKAVLTR